MWGFIKGVIVICILAAIVYFGFDYAKSGLKKLNDRVVGDIKMSGTVISWGRSGYIWPTSEGSLAHGGTQRSRTIRFSLDEEARFDEDLKTLRTQLDKAFESQEEVFIYGRKVLFAWPWRSGTYYHIYKVEFIRSGSKD